MANLPLDQRLSPDFTVESLTRSEWATRNGVKILVPENGKIHLGLSKLAVHILQPLDDALAGTKRSVIVPTSGYRPPRVNAAVGGSLKSLHMTGRAADFVAIGYTPMQVCKKIVAMNLPFDELICEFGRWTHCAVAAQLATPKRKILTAKKVGKKTVYLPGLVA